MLHFWARKYPVSDAAEETKISLKGAVDIYEYLLVEVLSSTAQSNCLTHTVGHPKM